MDSCKHIYAYGFFSWDNRWSLITSKEDFVHAEVLQLFKYCPLCGEILCAD